MIYNILCDGISIYNPSPSSAIINPKLELSVNEPGTLTFTMMPDHSSYDTIRAFTSNIEVYEGEELIFFGRILDIKTNFLKQKEVTCEGALGYLYDTVQYPVSFVPSEDHSTEQTTIHQFFTYLITEHNKLVTSDDRKFKIGTVNLTDADISRELAYDKTMDCVKQMCIDAFGGYLFVRKEDDGNYIDWLRDFSGVSAQPIQYAMNLTDLSQDFKGSDMVTSIIPIGDNGLDVSGKDDQQHYINKRNPGKVYIDSDAVATYGRVLEKVDFDGITDPEVLYEYGLKWLTDKQFDALSTDVTSADLSYFNPDYGVYKIGQSVHITSNPHLIDTNLPIQKISYNLDSPIKSITIGTPPRKSLTDMYSGGGGSGSSSSATEKSTINRIASSVVDEKVPGMVGNLVQYTPHLEGGYKIGALSIDETVHDLYSNVLYGLGDPSPSLGVNENIYISYSEPHARVAYVRTNYSNFGIEITNWKYKYNDKFELIFKNENNPNANGYWPAFMAAYNSDGATALGINYNMFARRQCINIRYANNYTGDSNISYTSPYDYTNYYKLVGDGAYFYLYKGETLDTITTTAFSYENWETLTTQTSGSVKLFCATGSTSMDCTFYSLKVWNSDGDLIHDYEPIENGVADIIDDTEYVTTTTGHINGPAVHVGGVATGIWHKENGIWVKENLADPNSVEVIDISYDDYNLLTPEEKDDPTKLYCVYNTPGGGGGGTDDYEELENLPTVNDIELIGNKTSADLGMVISVSQAEYDALSTEEQEDLSKVYYIWDADGGDGGFSGFLPAVYSESEKVVGLWTDGKPLYQRVVDSGALTQGTLKTISIAGLDMETCVRCSGFGIDPVHGWTISINDVTPGNVDGSFRAYVNVINENLYIEPGSDTGDGYSQSYIILQYTKTTDNPVDTFSYDTYGIFSPVIYSEEEREIGVWTDGKPLYEKVIYVQNYPSSKGSVNYPHNIANVDTIWIYDGYLTDGNGSTMPLNECRPEELITDQFGASIDRVNVQVRVGYDRSYVYAFFVARYTKTTDLSGSGNWTGSGVPSVKYSTDEQVIGTWIDGSTVYRKVIDLGSSTSFQPNTWTTISGVSLIGAKGLKVNAFDYASPYTDIHPVSLSINDSTGALAINQFRNATITVRYLIVEYTKSS